MKRLLSAMSIAVIVVAVVVVDVVLGEGATIFTSLVIATGLPTCLLLLLSLLLEEV